MEHLWLHEALLAIEDGLSAIIAHKEASECRGHSDQYCMQRGGKSSDVL